MSEDNQTPASSITRLEIFNKWLELRNLTRADCCFGLEKYILQERNINCVNTREILLKFITNVDTRWKTSNRDVNRFKSKNRAWLESTLELHKKEVDSQTQEPSTSGRPEKSFEDCCTRAKQKKVQNLTSTSDLNKLSFAVQSSLRKAGKRTAATIVQQVTLPSSPGRAQKYKRAFVSTEKQRPIALTPEEALALIINTKSSKSTYLAYRISAKGCNANIYPSWNKILSAKEECYPVSDAVKVTKTMAEIKLQDLLNLTIERICKLQEEVLNSIKSKRLKLVCKWGLDGSSGQSNYKQMTNLDTSDSSIIIISLVPLQLYDEENEEVIVWKNPVPSSTRYCRPIKFLFAKETTEIIMREVEAIKDQINKLNDFLYQGKIHISFKLLLTMVDGKVCNSLSETTSTQSCYICKATPLQMNDLKNVTKKLSKIENYSFGLSTLHSWIRFFECCLHVGYRLDIKCWQARGDNKKKMEQRKSIIVEGLKKELGILVDIPKPGYGSTNTGNTARVFFRNHKKAAEITGVDEILIKRFHIILQTISCEYEINSDKFKEYAMDTAKIFIEKYPWYYMPTSVHKVLLHGADIIKHAILPIGQLGEEAQEAKNKDFKFVREHRTRKDSAEHTNEDLFHYFLLSSDPVISSKQTSKNKLKLDADALSLLNSPQVLPNIVDFDSSSDSD